MRIALAGRKINYWLHHKSCHFYSTQNEKNGILIYKWHFFQENNLFQCS